MVDDVHTLSAASQHSLWPIIGHQWAVELLRRISDGSGASQPRHAYLFLGPRHIGKSTLALTFARSLLCLGQSGRPCGRCRSCQLVQRNAHADLRLVQPLGKDGEVDRLDGTLRSEQAAEIVHEVALRPVEGRFKIILIQDFQAANATFANKLLKTLEEPPESVIMLLTATDRSLVLPTILSRCQQFELRPINSTTIEQTLMARSDVAAIRAKTLARLANGRLGWALQQLQQSSAEEERRGQVTTLLQLIHSSRVDRLAFAEKLASDRNSLRLFEMLELWITWWRDVMLTQSGCADACSNIDYQSEIELLAKSVATERAVKYVQLLRYIEKVLHHTVNTRLALDVLLLQLPQANVNPELARGH